MKFRADRRRFLSNLGWATAAGMGLPFLSCDDPDRYTTSDADRLEHQKQREKELSGKSAFGVHRYKGYRGLADLPYFELDPAGRLKCVLEDLPPIIDFHTHLGIAALFAPRIDLLARTDRVHHFLDCDASAAGCTLDLDVYINTNFQEEDLEQLQWETVGQVTWGSQFASTHTIPNLIAEMDDCCVDQALVLPIALGLPFRDNLAEIWTTAIEDSNTGHRLRPGASVHPRDSNAVSDLKKQAALGAQAIKIHPAVQRVYPDDPLLDPIYDECGRLGMPVFFHGGRAGIEPEYAHRFTLIRHYEAAIAKHRDVNFILGHAGARDVADAIPFTRRHPNVFLDIHGQGIRQLDQMIDELGPERLVFGSDWPFYHLGASLAKVLIVTEGKPEIREAILAGNGRQLLPLA